MHIEKSSTGDLLEITVEGVLDNDSSVHFRDEIESCTRDGWHRIVVNLSGVPYVSSAGIAALISAKQQLDNLNGLFGIFNPTSAVATTLDQVRLLDRLLCDPQAARSSRAAGSMTMSLSSETRFTSVDGIDMEVYPLGDPQPLTCRFVGNTDDLLRPPSNGSAAHPVTFNLGEFGIGLGTLGEHADSESARAGEIIAVDGAVAQSPHMGGGLPDYSMALEEFTPAAQMNYGILCRGSLPTLIRFEPSEPGEHIGLSTLVGQAMKQTETHLAAFVILADCAGLIGAQMRRAPSISHGEPAGAFELSNVRDWLSFTCDRLYRRNLVVIAGLATSGRIEDQPDLRSWVRKMHPEKDLYGHFHAAVFPYQPVKKRTLDLHASVHELFSTGALQDVLHLLHDDRPLSGAGESEMLSGACWIGSIRECRHAEETA